MTRMHHPHLARRAAGLSTVWLIVVLVVVALVALVAVVQFAKPQPTDEEEIITRKERLDAALEQMQTRFAGAIEARQPTAGLLADADELTSQYPASAEAHRLHAQLLQLNGQPVAALAAWERALELDPKQAAIHIQAGALCMELGALDQAIAHYRAAVELEPGTPRHRLFLGLAFMKARQWEDARMALLTTLQLDPREYRAHAALSDVFSAMGKTEAALTQAKKCVDLVPFSEADHAIAYTLRYARLLREADREDEAMAALLGLPRELRYTPAISAALAEGWAKQGAPEKAAAHYDQALRLEPNNKAAAINAAAWHLKAGDLVATRRLLEAIRRVDPRSPEGAELDRQLRQLEAN